METTEHGLSYLELKYNLLASYCQFLSVFILLKLEGGTSLATHPVVDRLLYLKTLLERLRPLDQKLQYQVDKLLRTAALAESGVALDAAAPGKEDGMLYKANIENMVDKDDESEEGSEESEEGLQEDESEIEEDSEESEAGKKKAKDAKKPEVFKAAKLNPVLYEDKETKRARRQELFSKKNVLRSDYVAELRRELYDLPEEVHLGGMSSQRTRFAREQDQLEKLE